MVVLLSDLRPEGAQIGKKNIYEALGAKVLKDSIFSIMRRKYAAHNLSVPTPVVYTGAISLYPESHIDGRQRR